MADFVAVIRRAVDGLTDNTPEMRVRVYEKARGAVVRQLENMNPRPPEAMFKRQLDKLDDAIRQVEEEHGEALPADVVPAVDTAAAPVEMAQPVVEAQPVEPVAATAPAPEAVAAEPVHQAPSYEEPVHHEAQPEPERRVESAFDTTAYAEPVAPVRSEFHHEPAQEVHVEPAHHEPDHVEEPVAVHAEPTVEKDRAADFGQVEPTATPLAADHDDPLLSHFNEPREPAIRHATNRVMEEPSFEAESEFPGAQPEVAASPADPVVHAERPVSRPVASMPDWGVDIDREPEVAPEASPGFVDEHAPQMPRAALTETDVATGFNDFIKGEFSTPAVKPPPAARKEPEGDFSWDAPFDELPDLPKPVAFEQALHARQEELARAPETKAEQQRDARAELEDLIGYRSADDASRDGQGEKFSPEVTRGMSKLEGKSFKVSRKAKQKFNPIPIAFGVVAALIVAGGAYGAYTYREDVSQLVASYMPSDTTPAKTETRELDAKVDEQSKSITVKSDDAAKAKQATDEDKPTEVASLDPNVVTSKFTQRLMTDGTEAETDTAKMTVDPSLTEGKTIAGQTVASETEVASNDTKPATTTDEAAVKPGLTVAQKMILYEERLGDSPVAVQGKVTWKLAKDNTNASGKDQPMVEATVEVPDRKLKAIVSFKRNSDASLPASHIIEVVFDLPEDFAEGHVESVQRIAFKQTEQDRGNSLIAVPAKITDDFHMIALNDDADARKVNTELMKSRAWIDIPVVYRNNRRALLTFEKGSTGSEAFDKALAEWAALGPTANN
jgi:hypothetical protein